MSIKVYIGDYKKEENPATYTFLFEEEDAQKALDEIETQIIPELKYGMDVYIKNTNHDGIMYAYYRDLAEYSHDSAVYMIKNGLTGVLPWQKK